MSEQVNSNNGDGDSAHANMIQGVSPWADAWRRLKKNKMAMIGLWVVVGMSVLCTSVRWKLVPFAGFDPQRQYAWIGAQPPLTSHPDILNKNELRVGQEPQVPASYRRSDTLSFEVERFETLEYRIKARNGKIFQIRHRTKKIQQVQAKGKEFIVRPLGSGQFSDPLPAGAVFKVGGMLPEQFRQRPVLNLHLKRPTEGVLAYEAKLTDGKVTGLTLNGGTIEKASFDGRDVKWAKANGEPRTAFHLLGTDRSGRDVWTRTLYGGQISLLVGLVATIVSLLIGVVYGAISGYFGGKTDGIMMAVVDVLYGIPYMFLVILLLVNFGRNIVMLFVALGAVQWLTMARIVRGQILSLKEKEFIEAAVMSGTGHTGILFGHLIPNTLGVVVVYTTLTVPAVVLQESFLAFIGLTVEWEGQALDSWGALVKTGSDSLGSNGERSWLLLWPSLAMAATLFSLNFLGDGLRDALDPQQRGRT